MVMVSPAVKAPVLLVVKPTVYVTPVAVAAPLDKETGLSAPSSLAEAGLGLIAVASSSADAPNRQRSTNRLAVGGHGDGIGGAELAWRLPEILGGLARIIRGWPVEDLT
jgi:hypothetical protein